MNKNTKYKIEIKKTIDIYNLELPGKEEKLEIGKYTFKKNKNYQENVKKLNNKRNYGTHAITSKVIFGAIEKEANLGWTNKCTELDDILLLLTMFTGRKIFKNSSNNIKYDPPVCDHRNHQLGDEIRDIAKKNLKEMLEKAFKKLNDETFKKDFKNGEFLFLYEQALRVQHLRTSFLTCITIWENICKIQKYKNKNLINKLKYISEKYLLTKKNSENIEINNYKIYSLGFWFEEIRNIRNKATHEMIEKNEKICWERMKKFVKLTTRLIIIILELDTKKRFKNIKELQTFLYSDVDILSEIKNKEIIFVVQETKKIKNIKDILKLNPKEITKGVIKNESNTNMHLRDIINAMLINKKDLGSENTKEPLEKIYLENIANKNSKEILDKNLKIKEQNLEINENTNEKKVKNAMKILEEKIKLGYLGGEALSDYINK